MGFLFFRKQSQRVRWVEDSAPSLANNGLGVNYLGTAVSRLRIVIFGFIGFLALLVLWLRSGQLQLWEGEKFWQLAERNRLRAQPIIPERGIFFDATRVPLVTNVPNFRLTLRAQDLPRVIMDRETQIRALAATIGVSGEKIDQILNDFSKFRYASVVVKEPVTYEEAVSIYLRSAAFPSLIIERGAKRFYVVGVPGQEQNAPTSLAHVLGYLGRISPAELETRAAQNYYPTDFVGKVGLEAAYENILRGVPGQRDIEVDAGGNERRTVMVQEPIPGHSLNLTLDFTAQKILEQALRNGAARAGVRRAAALAIDPRDGSIKAMISLPTFSNNIFSGGVVQKDFAAIIADTDQPLMNRVVAGQFPSGSTLKPFIAAAALQEQIITSTTTVISSGGINVGDWFFPDWKDGGHGVTDVRKAIAESVNTFFYIVGGGYGDRVGLGPERIKKYLEYFGFGRSAGSEFLGEASGFIPSPRWKREKKSEQWYVGDTYNMSIGQGDILVTPLQMAYATAALINGGVLWKPRVVSTDIAPDGSEKYFLPQVAARVPIDEKWLSVVRSGMRLAVTGGSARSLSTLPITVAGKTGTAQWSKNRSPHAWFISFAPYENPEIVLVVLIEEGREGSAVATPVAKEFYEWWSKNR